MEKGQIMFRLFVPAHQNTPTAVHPRVDPLHDPPPRSEPCLLRQRLGLLASGTDMGREPELVQQLPYLVILIAVVQAHALCLLRYGLWPFDHEAVERAPHQFHVMPVGPIDRQPNRYAAAFGQQAALDPAFGAVGRIRPGFFPPRGVPWSSPRPCTASPTPCPSTPA